MSFDNPSDLPCEVAYEFSPTGPDPATFTDLSMGAVEGPANIQTAFNAGAFDEAGNEVNPGAAQLPGTLAVSTPQGNPGTFGM